MITLTPDHPKAGKVLAKADAWVDRRRAVQCAPKDEKARAVGRLTVAGDELAEAVEECRRPITPEMQFERGAAAARAGRARNSHQMNPNAAALTDWMAGYNSVAGEP